ncbi:MAG: helix-turn-helix domain-containing protein [Myxococcales bacterium]|nr:helix-turn-helix domain-containing protein [Myxococcales bacterium]
MRRVRERYLSSGVEMALKEARRPSPPPRLDARRAAAIVAMVCGPPPDGRARWTVRLLVEEVVKRGVVEAIGRETIRVLLKNHELKPWREKKMWCVPKLDEAVRGADGRHCRVSRLPATRRRRRSGVSSRPRWPASPRSLSRSISCSTWRSPPR